MSVTDLPYIALDKILKRTDLRTKAKAHKILSLVGLPQYCNSFIQRNQETYQCQCCQFTEVCRLLSDFDDDENSLAKRYLSKQVIGQDGEIEFETRTSSYEDQKEKLAIQELVVKAMMDEANVQKAIQDAKDNPGCHLWGSLPCTWWTKWLRMNLPKGGETFEELVSIKQAESRILIYNFRRIGRVVLQGGGTISFYLFILFESTSKQNKMTSR